MLQVARAGTPARGASLFEHSALEANIKQSLQIVVCIGVARAVEIIAPAFGNALEEIFQLAMEAFSIAEDCMEVVIVVGAAFGHVIDCISFVRTLGRVCFEILRRVELAFLERCDTIQVSIL